MYFQEQKKMYFEWLQNLVLLMRKRIIRFKESSSSKKKESSEKNKCYANVSKNLSYVTIFLIFVDIMWFIKLECISKKMWRSGGNTH